MRQRVVVVVVVLKPLGKLLKNDWKTVDTMTSTYIESWKRNFHEIWFYLFSFRGVIDVKELSRATR